MDIFAFSPETFLSFLLTFMRVSIVLFFLPFYGGDAIPTSVKVSVSLMLTLALWPKLAIAGASMPAHPFGLAVLLLGESVFGLVMGLTVHFIFAGLQTGGQVVGLQMGFSMLSFADPLSGAQVTATSQFLYMTALMVFLVLDGHLHLLRALTDSFTLVPPGGFAHPERLTNTVIELSAGMFLLAVRIAAPIIAALLLVELCLALMGRAAPQMNLITFGFPIKIAVGFFFLGLLFTVLANYMEDLVVGLGPMLRNLMRIGT